MSLPIEPLILKPRLTMLYIGAGSGLLIFFILRNNMDTGQLDWIILFIAGFCLLLWFLLRKTELRIDNDGLTHKTFFSTRQARWEEVAKTYIKYEHRGKSGRYYWNFIMTGGKDLKFSSSLYSRQSLRQIAEAVTTKCDKAEIQDRIYQMAQGRFPWYMF